MSIKDLLESAVNKDKANSTFTFFLNGDLNQMSIQKRYLNQQGIDSQQTDVYPVIKEADVEKALKLFYENKVEGWWNYERDYVNRGICTQEQYNEKLGRKK